MNPQYEVASAVRRALLISAVSAAGFTAPVMAQDAEEAADSLDTVVVTGSRIRQPNLTTTSPVTQVTAEDIATQGVTRIEDLINQLPQAFAAQNATVANGSTGTATIDLRDLGSARTLVLVDGRRMPYGGVTNSAADLNQIPGPLVERVEVLTGGASAVYGSDAVAGVVNFIMKKDFEGVEVGASYSFYQHNNDFGGPGAVKLRDVIAGRAVTNPAQFALPDSNVTDGYGQEAYAIMGVSTGDGRGNLTAYATFLDHEEILQRDRDFSACSLAGGTPTVSFGCGGSGTADPGTFTDFATFNFTVDRAGAGNTFRNFNAGLDQYNFGPVNHFLRPDRRYSLGVMGHYELSEKADVYTQLMFTDYRSVAQIAPGGAFFDTSTVNCDNPLLSAQQLAGIGCSAALIAAGDSVPLFIGRRNTEGGGRQQDFHNVSFRGVVGVRGDISSNWNYDASAQFSRLTADQQTLNYFVIERIARAIDVVTNPATGQPICRSALNGSDPGCVPYNIFQIGGVTQEALDYLQAPGIQSGVIDQEVFQASISGDLTDAGIKLPTANDGAKVVFGVEYRRDKLENDTDSLLSTASLSGTGGATIGITGSTKVTDLFMEAQMPLVQDKAFAKHLGVELAYRYSDYDAVSTDTYKLAADWAPVEDVRFRASYQRAVRAANIVELFTAQGFNLFDPTIGDPCGLQDRDARATAAECIATGVPAAGVGTAALDSPAGQFQFLQGGNPDLNPEESDTVTFGVVITPQFAPGLSVTIDYFDIKVDGLISTFGAENTLAACYFEDDAAACGRINRNALGQLWLGSGNVVDLNINIGSLETSGVDLTFNYTGVEIGKFGSLSFSLTGTYLNEIITNPGPGIDPYDCVGAFAGECGTPAFEWRHLARVGWKTPWEGVDMSLAWRYFGKAEQFGVTNLAKIDRSFGAENYFDLFGSWTINEKASVRLGVNNILDNDPQINNLVGTTGNGNTYPQTYDALGRYIFAGVKYNF